MYIRVLYRATITLIYRWNKILNRQCEEIELFQNNH